jgi:hypothetical protein
MIVSYMIPAFSILARGALRSVVGFCARFTPLLQRTKHDEHKAQAVSNLDVAGGERGFAGYGSME